MSALPRVNPPEPPSAPKEMAIRMTLIVDGVPVESKDVEVPLPDGERTLGRITEPHGRRATDSHSQNPAKPRLEVGQATPD